MAEEQFRLINFQDKTLDVIVQANEIIAEYEEEGYTLTLRQLFYQFVARDLLPNTQRQYKRLGDIMTNARISGLVDWDAIEDRGRNVHDWLIQTSERVATRNLENRFALDLWDSQDTYVEVWVEKDALNAVIERPCARYRVPFLACKGYLSASEAYRAGKRFEDSDADRKVIIHLGDHDPSGIDMTRDNRERIHMFSWDNSIEVRRIALNRDQVDLYKPPPNFAKMTDSRVGNYIDIHGDKSWELDALEPRVIDELVANEIRSLIDMEIWQGDLEEEREREQVLRDIYRRYDEVAEFLQGDDDDDLD